MEYEPAQEKFPRRIRIAPGSPQDQKISALLRWRGGGDGCLKVDTNCFCDFAGHDRRQHFQGSLTIFFLRTQYQFFTCGQ